MVTTTTVMLLPIGMFDVFRNRKSGCRGAPVTIQTPPAPMPHLKRSQFCIFTCDIARFSSRQARPRPVGDLCIDLGLSLLKFGADRRLGMNGKSLILVWM